MINEKDILKRIAGDLNLEHIVALCRAYHVREIYLFGSAVNGELSDRSDIDFAVRFEREGFAGSFDQYFDFKAALEKAVSRPVDLVCLPALRNSVFRKQVESTRRRIKVHTFHPDFHCGKFNGARGTENLPHSKKAAS